MLLSVHRSFATYDPRYPFRAWLKAVVTSRVRDALRVQYATVERLTDEGELPDQAAPDATSADSVHELLESALQGLNEIQRRIFTALKLEGRTVRETAAELGMSEGATKVAAHRAYQKIRTELTKEDAE